MSADWRDLTWYEYTLRLWHWNDRHGEHEAPRVDPAKARSMFDKASLH